MKLPILLFLALPAIAFGGFKLPGKVFEIADLEKAKAEAAQKGRPIAILLSNKDSTCPLCSGASETILRELGPKTVMVYVRDTAGLPPAAIEALSPGKYIPKVAVLDATLDQALGTVTYEAIKDDRQKAFREVTKAIRGYKK
ncbi:MAG: hypothetical protein ABMA01_06240 [Chthoniobacteraceae bacterium]